MRHLVLKPSCLLVFLFVGLVSSAWGTNPCPAYTPNTDCLQVVNAGASYVMGGVYTSPYGISILSVQNVPVNNPTPTLMICDDFTTDISLNQTWNSVVTSFDQLQNHTNPASTPKWCVSGLCAQGSNGPANIQGYAVAAVLSAELMTLPGSPNVSAFANQTAGEISYALWGVFDPGLLTSTAQHPTGNDAYGTLTTAQFNAANSYLTGAENLVAAATSGGIINLSSITVNGESISGLSIYTPDPLNSSQEFLQVSLVPMPESSVPTMLAVDLFGVGALILFFRRRASK